MSSVILILWAIEHRVSKNILTKIHAITSRILKLCIYATISTDSRLPIATHFFIVFIEYIFYSAEDIKMFTNRIISP